MRAFYALFVGFGGLLVDLWADAVDGFFTEDMLGISGGGDRPAPAFCEDRFLRVFRGGCMQYLTSYSRFQLFLSHFINCSRCGYEHCSHTMVSE